MEQKKMKDRQKKPGEKEQNHMVAVNAHKAHKGQGTQGSSSTLRKNQMNHQPNSHQPVWYTDTQCVSRAYLPQNLQIVNQP